VVALALFAYSNSLGGAFVFDDVRMIRDNPWTRDLAAAAGPAGYRATPTRYLAFVSFALNHRLGGFDPFGFHLANLVIHVVASAVVYLLGVLVFRAPLLSGSRLRPAAPAVAFVAAALFATHPVGTQAVTYVVQRLTSLAALLYLASVTAYLSWRIRREGSVAPWRGGLRFGLVLLFALLAVRTKEFTLTLPAALWLLEVLLFPPAGWRRFLPVLPVAAIALLIPASQLGFAPSGPSLATRVAEASRLQSTVDRLDYLRTQMVVVVKYLLLLAYPSGQNLDHDVALERSWLAPRVLASASLLVALLALAVWLARRSAPGTGRRPLDPAFRVVSLGIGWFLLTNLVESSVIPIADLMYEHRAYLPSVGIFLAAATLLGLLLVRWAPVRPVRALLLVGTALALALAAFTLRRNAVWESDVTLWADSASKSPNKFRPHLNLGSALVKEKRFEEGEAILRRAIEIDPGQPTAHTALGALYHRTGRLAAAEAEYRAALDLSATDFQALFNLGELLWNSGRRPEAGVIYARYLEIAGDVRTRARDLAASRVQSLKGPPSPPPP
jgi:tetratricopeptide (TPR) repeat protein